MQQKIDKWDAGGGDGAWSPLLENRNTDAKMKLLGTVCFLSPSPLSPSFLIPSPKKRPGEVSLIIPKGLVWTSEPRMQQDQLPFCRSWGGREPSVRPAS